ncbi:MAG: hypothetical protein BA863_04480 [Desulfovibrio sp. S3730MH75]|nr:MAG: hypothetical protein BA863_04480 [Desulfovibrio sp. S3730MH75]
MTTDCPRECRLCAVNACVPGPLLNTRAVVPLPVAKAVNSDGKDNLAPKIIMKKENRPPDNSGDGFFLQINSSVVQ